MINDLLTKMPLLPLIVINDINDIDSIADSLISSGIHCIEVTLRSAEAMSSIKEFSKHEDILVGAGTVISLQQAIDSVECGAKFIVSPGFNIEIASWCKDHSIDYFPGCVTPTEIMSAINCGIETLKFFPSNVYGGLTALNALKGPFINIKFIPTGGINDTNYLEYIKQSNVFAVGGSFIIPPELVNSKNWSALKEHCRKLVMEVEKEL